MKKYTATIDIFNSGSEDFTRPSKTNSDQPIRAKELMPLANNQDKRFQTDILLNGKTRFEEKNTIIKSLAICTLNFPLVPQLIFK